MGAILSGLIRAGVPAAAGAQSGAIAGEERGYERQVQMEQMARQEAETEARIEQDKAHALYYEGRNAVLAKHYQDQLRADQQKADDLKAHNAALAAQHQSDTENRNTQAALGRKAAWDRMQAEIKSRQDPKEKPGETRQQYLAKRLPVLMKPGKPDFMGNAAAPPDLQSAVKQANSEYDAISGQQAPSPAVDESTPDPRLGQWHQTMTEAQQLHAKALANGVPQDQADAALGNSLLRAHKTILGVTGPMQPPGAAQAPGAPAPGPGASPYLDTSPQAQSDLGRAIGPGAAAERYSAKPISPIQPPLGAAPPPVAAAGALPLDPEEEEDNADVAE